MRMQCVLVAVALSAPLTGVWAADTPDPDSLPKVACKDFKYSEEFLAKYPKANVLYSLAEPSLTSAKCSDSAAPGCA